MVSSHITMLEMMFTVSNIRKVYTIDRESNNTNQGCMEDNDTDIWLSSDHIWILARYGVNPRPTASAKTKLVNNEDPFRIHLV